MNFFYENTFDENSKFIELDKLESQHITKSLRLKIGDFVFVTNGKGLIAKGQINSFGGQKTCTIQVVEINRIEPTKPKIYLGIAPTKSNDKNSLVIEKMTELRINEVILLKTFHSERKEIKLDRLERVSVSAMKQSHSAFKPVLSELTEFKNFIQKDFENVTKLIATCDIDFDRKKLSEINLSEEIFILIGAEGDFSKEEIELAIKKGFIPVNLGESRMRTETAAIYAVSALKALTEGG